jgi:hypothetical protein
MSSNSKILQILIQTNYLKLLELTHPETKIVIKREVIMPITLELDSTLQVQIEQLAQTAGLSLSEWIRHLLHNQISPDSPRGLTTTETSEDILQREMTPYSGWTWKTDKL